MALQPALTWTTLTTHFSAAAWAPLFQWAHTTYAQQGQVLTAAQYLALPPAAAAAPLLAAPDAPQQLVSLLSYKTTSSSPSPLRQTLLEALVADGVPADEVETGLASANPAAYLAQVLTPAVWARLAAAAQRQARYALDKAGRADELAPGVPALAATYDRARATQPDTPLEDLATLPANELARALWVPAPATDEQFISLLAGELQAAAQRAQAANYLAAELPERLLDLLDPALRAVAKAVLDPAAPVASPAELAELSLGELAQRLASLPANHPVVFALVAAVQAAVQQALLAHAPAPLPLPAPLSFSVQLLDVTGAPLANFALVLRQGQDDASGYLRADAAAPASQPLGTTFTDADGRARLRVARSFALTDDDTLAEQPVQVRAALYLPGQDLAGEPLLTLLLAPTTEGEELTFPTTLDLAALTAPPASAPITGLRNELSEALSQILQDNGFTTLADVRAAGGLQTLLASYDQLDDDERAAVARLEALAQFEVVAPEMAFNEQVVAAGFDSPAQLLATASPDEFVQRLGLADAPAEQRAAAQAFYQQTANTQALSQTLGLLLAGARASGTVPGPQAAPTPFFQGALRAASAQNNERETFASEQIAEGDPVASDENAASAADGADGSDGPVAQRQTPGATVVAEFNPAPNPDSQGYDSSQQCDCPACRSAVSPTAYLASLLNYAATNLRDGNNGADPGWLQRQFRQPFADLRVSCQTAEELVCQYRLAIEVLHAHARNTTPARPALQVYQAQDYLDAVVESLLQALGTSLAELRTTPTAELPDLAKRLALSVATLEGLREKFGVQAFTSYNSLAGMEADLDRFFGLANTSRDALSDGESLDNTTEVNILRWNLQGLEWGVNTSSDGTLFVEILHGIAGSPDFAVVVYKSSLVAGEVAKVEDNVVARGDLHRLDFNDYDKGYAALLYPQHGSGLRGSIQVYLANSLTSAGAQPWRHTRRLAAIPRVTASQQEFLQNSWQSEDLTPLNLLRAHDRASWNGDKFIIDPDLLGPDDFRPAAAVPGNTTLVANKAYQLWYQRYAFLQDKLISQLLPGGDSMVSELLSELLDNLTTVTVNYPPTNATWNGKIWVYSGSGTAALASARADLDREVNTTTTPQGAFGLSAEGIIRLYDLWQRSLFHTLTDDELQEALDLVRQSAKRRLSSAWVSEEAAKDIKFVSLKFFQPALHEPLVGGWAPTPPGGGAPSADAPPRLDPDELTPLDLPDTGLGSAAASIWGGRQAELLAKRQELIVRGQGEPDPADRVLAMLGIAYTEPFRTPTPGLPGAPPLPTLARLGLAYHSEADPQHQATLDYVRDTLALRPAEVERLLALAALAPTQPTDGLWQELAALLTLGWKRTVAYSQRYEDPDDSHRYIRSWKEVETDAFPGSALDVLLQTRKHRLVKWRATPEGRAVWEQALAQLTERPLIDPDQFVAGDFRQAGVRSRVRYTPAPSEYPFSNVAYDVFAGRTGAVKGWFTAIKTNWPATDATAQWTYAAGLLGTTATELIQLSNRLAANTDVRAALRRLGLPAAGLTLLADQINRPGTTNRLDEVFHLLVQVQRSRAYAGWALDERALGLSLSPQYFRRPVAEPEALVGQPWRSSPLARRQWQRTLSARYAQAEALTAAREQAVRSAEDRYLRLLRDALIHQHIPNDNTTIKTFADKAEWLNNRYLLDFKTACCQHTTRVAQAIEVLQKLLNNLRGGLANNGVTLASGLTTLDADWQWLGSYERWRSLLFLYLYPQNVLLPALKPGQTAQFRQTVSAIRQAPSLSPADARRYLEDYQAYLTDMGTLKIATATETTVTPVSPSGLLPQSEGKLVSVNVALAANRAAYANIFSILTPTAEGNYTWTRLPGHDPIERIVGSAAHKLASGERYVYVFALLREAKKDAQAAESPIYLAFQRLNLRTLSWADDFTPLALKDSDSLDLSSVHVVASVNETWAPVVMGLRNRRPLLYTEYPFSQDVQSVHNVADSGERLYLSRIILGWDFSARIHNYDLFFLTLDTAGSGVGMDQSRTIFMCNDAYLMGGVRTNKNSFQAFTFLRMGAFSDANRIYPTTLSIFRIELKDYGSQTRYLIPRDLKQLGAVSPVSRVADPDTEDNELYSKTDLFRSGSELEDLFKPVMDNVAALLNATVTPASFPIESVGLTVATAQGNNALPVKAYNSKAYLAGLRLIPTQSLTNDFELKNFNIYLYYNLPSRTTTTTDISTYCLSFFSKEDAIEKYPATQAGPAGSSSDTQYDLTTARDYMGPALGNLYQDNKQVGPTIEVLEEPTTSAQSTRYGQLRYYNSTGYRLHGVLPTLPPLVSSLSAADQQTRRSRLTAVNSTYPLAMPSFVNTLVGEAYYSLPLLLAQELVRSRNYELALRYYRLVYDYTQDTEAKRFVYPGLVVSNPSYTLHQAAAWLHDPSNPYTIAGLRPDAHLQYTTMSVARCLLAYADTEFTADTVESVARARGLYELAGRLLKQDIIRYETQTTASLLDPLDVFVPAAWQGEWRDLKATLARVNMRNALTNVLYNAPFTVGNESGRGLSWFFIAAAYYTNPIPWDSVFNQAYLLVDGQLANLPRGYLTLGATQDVIEFMENLTPGQEQDGVPLYTYVLPAIGAARPYVPFLGVNFCVPTNPVPAALALQAELNLFKIRSCRNIAGVQRELEPYAAATDTTTGLPTLNASGQLTRSARLVVPATQYRYAFIMERARQLVALAQQTESALLSAFEKRDAEAYTQLKARQDIASSQATVQLQTLRLVEAEDGVDLAGLQLERSQLTEQQYAQWLSDGLNGYERDMLDAIREATRYTQEQVRLQAETSTNSAVGNISLLNPLSWYGALSSVISNTRAGIAGVRAAAANGRVQLSQNMASFERRKNEWTFQKTLATQDVKIGRQQIRIADDQVRIRGQEKQISQLQLDHAQAVLDFLTTKFTNAELYDWMSRVLESAYGYFLQQATATARLAEQQLAFERQQVPAGIVLPDYYSDPADDASASLTTDGSGSTGTSRKGLTGSVRLLQDLTRLDEYAFETNRRKLQLSKTISLAQSFPTEFVRFRETGLLSFACPPEWFDQDFPGQYLRVLRRVRTSVIALVPPVDGIKARLSTAGTSHVTVDGTPFQTLALPRAPEAVALTAPLNATGLYELDTQNELLLPFEGLGVDVPWQFAMQPASNPGLDYSAVADVLITLDYSALESADYARQVVQQLGTDRTQMVALSLRDRFADQWYDLHHADELAAADQYVARLLLTADDLPRHLRQATVRQVSLFVDAPLDDAADATDASPAFTDRSRLELRLTRGASMGGAAFTNEYGLISTRTGTGAGLYSGNAAALVPLLGKAPAGEWVLTVAPGRLRERLAAGLVNDIYLILEVEGQAPEYVL